MAKRVPNKAGLRTEMEKRSPAIALNASGSYVLPSFDPVEWEHVQKQDFFKLDFDEEDAVVIAHGTHGSIARFARLTDDRKYARYFGGKYISLALIQGEAFSKTDFVRSLGNQPTLLVEHAGKQYLGVLHGDIAKSYKTLVYAAGDRFLLLDLEESPPPQHSSKMVRIIQVEPAEGAAAKADLLTRFS